MSKSRAKFLIAMVILIGRSYEENRSLVTIDQIPSVFVNALLAQEDQRFWEHNGVDWVGVACVLLSSIFKAGDAPLRERQHHYDAARSKCLRP